MPGAPAEAQQRFRPLTQQESLMPRHRDLQDSGEPMASPHGAVGPVVCPACGHALSMFTEPSVTPPERVATRMAVLFGSWRFLVVLVAAVAAWVAANAVWHLFGPGPELMMNYLNLALTVLAAVQLPLILLSQRQDILRDRARDREALRVAANAEADLHAIRHAVTGQQPSLADQTGTSPTLGAERTD